MDTEAKVVVIGLGAMGAAATWQLAARGVPVTGIDQFAPPHPYGSTHGETRITRLAVGEGPEYVPLVLRSHELWRELEAETGQCLLHATGGLILGTGGNEFLASTRASAERFGILHEDLEADELRRRFPMFTAEEGTEAYFEPEAGWLSPEATVSATLELGRRHGAALCLGQRVTGWSATDEGVEIITDGGIHRGERLVLCAGPWLGDLFPEGRERFAVYRQLLLWFPVAEAPARLAEMPVFVWDFGGVRGAMVHLDGFYGFPPVGGPHDGLKVATEAYGQTTVPDGRQHSASAAEAEHFHREYLAARLPWLGTRPVRSVSCLYTSTLGSRFVIDRHPEHDNVLIVSACSGHGFKHSPAIGEAVARWAAGEAVSADLAPFTLAALGDAESASPPAG
jgi:sarcosine oxidase